MAADTFAFKPARTQSSTGVRRVSTRPRGGPSVLRASQGYGICQGRAGRYKCQVGRGEFPQCYSQTLSRHPPPGAARRRTVHNTPLAALYRVSSLTRASAPRPTPIPSKPVGLYSGALYFLCMCGAAANGATAIRSVMCDHDQYRGAGDNLSPGRRRLRSSRPSLPLRTRDGRLRQMRALRRTAGPSRRWPSRWLPHNRRDRGG